MKGVWIETFGELGHTHVRNLGFGRSVLLVLSERSQTGLKCTVTSRPEIYLTLRDIWRGNKKGKRRKSGGFHGFLRRYLQKITKQSKKKLKNSNPVQLLI
jgi:hypothetical protein